VAKFKIIGEVSSEEEGVLINASISWFIPAPPPHRYIIYRIDTACGYFVLSSEWNAGQYENKCFEIVEVFKYLGTAKNTPQQHS
jgi:hypothetical protein